MAPIHAPPYAIVGTVSKLANYIDDGAPSAGGSSTAQHGITSTAHHHLMIPRPQ